MSVNVGAKSAERGKKLSPSKKNKNASPLKRKTKTETSNPGCSSVTGSIEKYLIKKTDAVGLKRGDNNNVCESKSKSTSDRECEDKLNPGDNQNVKNQTDVNVTESKKADDINSKEPSPEPEFIVVDDSFPDSDISTAVEKNDSKEVSDVGVLVHKDINGGKDLATSSNSEKQEQPQKEQSELLKPGSQADSEDGTDNVENENEAETQDTLEYDLDSAGDARMYVDYKDEDFNTDTDLDKSDLDTESREAEDSEQAKEEKGVIASGSKRKTTAMGSWFSRKKRQEKCHDLSSSDEEIERPALRQRPRRPYPSRSPRVSQLKRRWSDWDTQQYRAGYPDKTDDPRLNKNALFYQSKIPSRPDGSYIDEFHKNWWHDHDRLESRHGYIQWLFPIRESGMNVQAQELQRHEAETIRSDPLAMRRFKRSYEMMLYFYGIKLLNKETGEVDRADNWQSRFKHLNHSTHNYLRITRILKCLGEMGLEHFKPPFLRFMLREAATTRRLDRTLDSCTNFWIGTVKDDREREKLDSLAQKLCQRVSTS